jgi:adenosylcobyric acid synthase
LEAVPDVSVEYIQHPPLDYFPDLLIIPGTKNTIEDLDWLIECGFREYIARALEHKTFVLGICGGYQMLGQKVSDPQNVEAGGTRAGLGLLPVETELQAEKITIRSRGRSFLGAEIEGYEIHMGRTTSAGTVAEFCRKMDGAMDGVISDFAAGTYFHGLFENAEFTERFLTYVAERRRRTWRPSSFTYSKESAYSRLAQITRDHLDVRRIYEILNGGL